MNQKFKGVVFIIKIREAILAFALLYRKRKQGKTVYTPEMHKIENLMKIMQ